ncbi:B3 domain-containing Os01g0234100-like [Olea europaea subsp. europaea]|uniref:B3 domain-containing Os01g0234100-like n=2 Tax=Olea europaea subsp. europaea TaxID=158383 RepID=A0A8S0P8K4_OLEEU|nr:B3 domain-containing Os01g0234100-like [Olea europaea subsp. europaea]
MTASAERIRQNTQKWDGQENRQNHTGNFINVVKQEVEKEREEESAVLISENNEVKQEVDFEQQKHREDESELSTSESEDDANISQILKSKGKQIDCSSVEVRLNSRSPKSKRKMESVDGNSGDTYSFAMKRAKEVRAKLDPRFPSFLKLMLRSHVSGGFWLHIPSSFCKLHMPKHDQTIVLEDETGKAYEVKYLADKMALSAGWKGFSIQHNLLEGDVIVFHFMPFNKIKVYIVRASSSGEIIDGALCNSNLNANAGERDLGGRDESKNGEDSSGKNTDGVFEGSFVDFQEFHVTVNNVIIDSMLTEDVRRNYYELCLARSSYLHDLLKSDNNMLAAGIITETTKIANNIRECKLSTSNDDFAMWDKTLEGFEVLGMDVRFLRSRLSYLVNIASKMRETPRLKRYAEARLERDCREEEIQILKSRLQEIKQAKMKLDNYIAVLKVEVGSFEVIFEEEANRSWS